MKKALGHDTIMFFFYARKDKLWKKNSTKTKSKDVLAYNTQQKEYDGRISRENKEWASEYHIENDMIDTYSPRNRYIIHTHNGLLDIFANRVRKVQQLFSDMSQTVTESENLTDEAEE